MLENCLYVLQDIRSIIYVPQFIHLLSLCSRGNGTSFAFTSHIIISAKFWNVTFLNNLFCFILLLFVHLPAPKKNETCDIKQKLLKFLFSLFNILLSYLSLLLNSNKASEIIFKTVFDGRKGHIPLHITKFVQQ